MEEEEEEALKSRSRSSFDSRKLHRHQEISITLRNFSLFH